MLLLNSDINSILCSLVPGLASTGELQTVIRIIVTAYPGQPANHVDFPLK